MAMVLLNASHFRAVASDTTRAAVMTTIMAPIMIVVLICGVFKLARHRAKFPTHIIPINSSSSHVITSLTSLLRKLRLGMKCWCRWPDPGGSSVGSGEQRVS